MSTRTLAAALVAAATLSPALGAALVVAAPAEARPTCHGVPATKVGQPKANMLGSKGRDVVVTNGARGYRTNGGDDLVCVTGSARSVDVDGTGADERVYVVSTKSSVHFAGGTGSDTFVGGPQYDSVRLFVDGTDRVDTRGASDFVELGHAPGHQKVSVSLGAGPDSLWVDADGLTGTLDGGRDTDDLTWVHKSKKDWLFDNASGKARADGQRRFRWRSFEGFDLTFFRAPKITFLGGDGAESVTQQDLEGKRPTYAFAMGGGDDSVSVASKSNGTVDGGAGVDLVTVRVNFLDGLVGLDADLLAHRATVTYAQGGGAVWGLGGVEDLTAGDFPTVTLRGDDADNVLTGASGNDTIVGGGGTDTAIGGAGTDTCDAEVRTGCELP